MISTVPKRQPPGGDVQRYEVVDLLSLLADKSLVVTDDSDGRTRYRLLETVRQYALEKLRESGDADAVRARHRDHYAAVAAGLDAPSVAGHERRLNQAELEIDNLRAAFAFSRENGDTGHALLLASCLQPLWRARGRLQEGWPGSPPPWPTTMHIRRGPTLGCMRGHWPTGP